MTTSLPVVPSLANLTPDEKRNLIFNVNDVLEIPIKDFNDNWWPLVTNIWTQYNSWKLVNGDYWKVFTCRLMKHRESSKRQDENIPHNKRRKTAIRPAGICQAKIKVSYLISSKIVRVERYKKSADHTHDIGDNDKVKRSQAVRILVENEANKNYSPPDITAAVKEYATDKLGLGSSINNLKRKEVANIKYKIRGPMEAHLIGSRNLNTDITETISYLTNQGYQVESYRVSQRSTKGIVFACPEQLKKLQQYGWLTLIDSTHKTNRYDWRLFTLYIRDSYGCWDVGAHFFVSKEDGDTVANALKIIREKYCQWTPRYILSDQSSIEARSIQMTFPGLSGGEQECEVILCTVHIMRTWMAKIYHKKTRDSMIGAMHKRTKIGCEKLLQDAIDGCPVPTIKTYIRRNYESNTHQWALWARQHSPLLLQVTSTNALESYHSELKSSTSSSHGLIGNSFKPFIL